MSFWDPWAKDIAETRAKLDAVVPVRQPTIAECKEAYTRLPVHIQVAVEEAIVRVLAFNREKQINAAIIADARLTERKANLDTQALHQHEARKSLIAGSKLLVAMLADAGNPETAKVVKSKLLVALGNFGQE